ncbi:MAG: cytochrome b/b6 domain-containing protein [Cyanobium sp.]
MARPYQPSLLRLLHGITALLVPLAWLSGLLVYSRHDGRLLRLPLSLSGDWIDIHGTIGVLLWPVALLFVLYAISMGRARLRQPANAIALIALLLAVGSGKMMQEEWLRIGALDHWIYSLHLVAWLLIAVAVALHLIAAWRRGGMPLLRSMASRSVRSNDRPGDWPRQIQRALKRPG